MSKRRRLGAIDLDTGEMVNGVNIYDTQKRTGFQLLYGWNYCFMSQNSMMKIAADKELTGQQLRVFLYLTGKMDFENFLRIRQEDIAKELDMQKADVSRAMKLLETKGVLQRGPKVAQSYTWRMNPNYGYKGDPRGKVRKERDGSLQFINSEETKP